MTNNSNTGYFLDFQGDPKDYTWVTNKTKTNFPMADIPKKYREDLRKTVNIGSFFELANTPNISVPSNKKIPTTFYSQVWQYIKYSQEYDKDWSTYTDSELADIILGTGDPNEYAGKLSQYKNKGAFLYTGDWLTTKEGSPDSTHSGFAFWAQDLELDNTIASNINSDKSQNSNALDSYAGIAAVLWAGRQKLGKGFQITPVTSKSVNVNLLYDPSKGYTNELIDLKEVFDQVNNILPSALKNGYFASNNVPSTTVTMNDKSQKQIDRTSWNFMSLLFYNEIINGFISERYTQEDVLRKRTIQMNPVAAFYEPSTVNMPYALQGAINNPAELPDTPIASPLFKIDYNNKGFGMDSALYFSPKGKTRTDIQNSAEKLEPASYFKPKVNSLMSHNASAFQSRGICVIDMSTLPSNSTSQVQINLSREASYESNVGFYIINSSNGSVNDPITGQTIEPGDEGYQKAALAADNSIENLGKLLLQNNGSLENTKTTDLNGSILIAPYAEINANGVNNTFFSFEAANEDGINHFKVVSKNKFGMEDTLGGGDFDFNDLVIDFQFLNTI